MLYFMSNVKRYQFIKNIVKRDQINIKLDDADHISSAWRSEIYELDRDLVDNLNFIIDNSKLQC